MNFGQTRVRLVEAGAVFAAVALVAGCGSQYRPVVTPINPSGPAAQPTSLAVVVSAPSPTTAGIATIIDYSGDTVVATAPIGLGPITFTLDQTGSTGYTVNSDGTLTNFPASSNLQAKNVSYTTLPTTAQPTSLLSPSAGLWASDLTGSIVDVLTGYPETFKLAVPVAPTPIEIIGAGQIGERNYSVSLNTTTAQANGIPIIPYDLTCNTPSLFPTLAANGQIGEADAIEIASYTVSNRIPLGVCPVYSVVSQDQRRTFVLNRGSDTVTVINSQINALNSCVCPPTGCVNQNGQTYTCHPSLPLSTSAGLAQDANKDVPAKAGPVYAEYNVNASQLIVADYDGNAISVIDVSLDEYGNDSPTFGTTFTIPVGNSPASVTALPDFSRAYTANQSDSTVTIVNLSSHSVEKTLPVIGHPRTVVSTANSLYGKVYVASPDSPYLTILRTDLDIVDTTVLVQGNIVDVRVSTQNGASGNSNNVSRKPGAGQPCYMPGVPASLTACQTLP
jgi:DNA-binding beta-propeller fold protein YncE